MTDALIPDRSNSTYANQYATCHDPDRLRQILSESVTIALHSKDPATAMARRDLAIEAYHQLVALDAHSSVHAVVVNMVTVFPSRVRLNEASGLVAKATKLKTPAKKATLLRNALSLLQSPPEIVAATPECVDLAKHITMVIATLPVR
jgi:hypothetical protein